MVEANHPLISSLLLGADLSKEHLHTMRHEEIGHSVFVVAPGLPGRTGARPLQLGSTSISRSSKATTFSTR